MLDLNCIHLMLVLRFPQSIAISIDIYREVGDPVAKLVSAAGTRTTENRRGAIFWIADKERGFPRSLRPAALS